MPSLFPSRGKAEAAAPASTPQKTYSSQAQGSSSVYQEELKRKMSDELSNQVWQFPPARIAEMLCPFGLSAPPIEDAVKSLTSTLTSLAKSDFSRVSLAAGAEARNYLPLANIMNACIDSCVEVIEKCATTPRWFADLQFIVWDKEMSDGVDGAKPLKPGLGGVIDPPAPEHVKLYWNLAEENETNRRLLLPFEVKENDMPLVTQAAMYARMLNSVVPFRAFELVLTYNQNSDQFRFLIFHRGGLTSSEPIKLRYTTEKNKSPQPPNCTDLVRMFMSILIWTKAGDAGYPLFSNGRQFILPDPDPLDPTLAFNFAIDEVLYQNSAIRSRNTWVARLAMQGISAPGKAPHATTTVDLHEGQQSKNDTRLSHSEAGPSWKSVRLRLRRPAKAIQSTSDDADKTKTQKRKLGMLDIHSFMHYVLIAA